MLLTLCSIAMAGNICDSNSPPATSKLYMLNKEIKNQDLGNFNVTENLQIKVYFYNICEKKITSNNFSIEDLEITIEPDFKVRESPYYSNKELLQENGTVIINLNITLAGKYILSGKYFPLKTYNINFIPGEPSEKSILEVDKTVIKAGEKVTVYIIPYDKYENLIDANIYKDNNNDKNPFIVSYNNLTSNKDNYAENFEVVKIINYLIISYDVKLTQAGDITISGKVGENILNHRTVTVKHAEIDFYRSEVYKYEDENNKELIKDGTVITTSEIGPKFRLYLKDKYGNAVELPEEKLKNLNSYLNFTKYKNLYYNFKLNDEEYAEKQYAEFVIDDDNKNRISFNKLIYGNYDLVFTDKSENLLYNIILDNGCPSDKPFKCSYRTTKCAASQIECGCPDNYIKCPYMNYCVKYYRTDMCFYPYTYVKIPNQKVCPVGKILCPDLSCRDNYNLCKDSDYCPLGMRRCPDQSCQSDTKDCPNTINCGNSSKYVCNNDKCVDSELECDESVICNSGNNTYLCDGNTCASSWEECPKKKSCVWSMVFSTYLSLCEDGDCKPTCP